MNFEDVNVFESDDEIQNMDMPRRRRPRVFRERINYFQHFNDEEFLARFRLTKQICRNILRDIADQIKSPTRRSCAISPALKLLLTLRFLATGSMLIVVGDFMGISKASASKIVKEVCVAIASMRDQYIKFPTTPEEKSAARIKFYEAYRFPFVCGAIDCTHIRIQSPGGANAEVFRNRKGFFSWNVQTVCDRDLYILDIVSRWPGSTHDQTIFNNSRLKARFENGEMGNSVLLGDSGYGLTNYLITPLANPVTEAEQLFNESQIRTRNCVERKYGVWKRRFPILSLGIKVSLETSKIIIVAAAILHNIAIKEKIGMPPDEMEVYDENFGEIVNNEPPRREVNRRRIIIDTHFANLIK